MADQSDARSIEQSILFSALAALGAILIGTAALTGWALDFPILKSVIPGYIPMMPNTALCFVAAGTALGLSGPWRRTHTPIAPGAVRLLAGGIALAGTATLVQYGLNLDLGIDRLLFGKSSAAEGWAFPGRMATATAKAFVCLGVALIAQDSRVWLFQAASLTTALIGLSGTTSYFYQAESLGPAFVVPISLHSALTFLLVGSGVLLSRPRAGIMAVIHSEYLGGMSARRIIPLAVAAPILVGWLELSGQRAGLYSTATAAALFATITVTVMVVLVWFSARAVNAIDRKRAAAAESTRQSASEVQAMNQRLVASEERFRLFMEFLPGSAFLKDAEGRYVWGNPAWRRQFPHVEEVLSKTDADLWPPDTCAIFQSSDRKVLEQQAPVQVVENIRLNSEAKHLMVSKFPVCGPSGSVLIGGVSFDLTERKNLETQLFQAQKLEAIGLLAGGVAHDFNNLLTVILGFSEEIKFDYERGRPPYENVEEIQSAARKAAALTSQLLAFGRKQVMQPRVLNLNDTLAEMHRMLRRVLREDIHLQLSLSPDAGNVQADPVQIQQVLINLTMNAQDAMPLGGRITIETSNVDLDESYVVSHRQVQPGPYVLLAVSDTGTGIDEKTKAHIFEPFYTTKAVGKGTGLGLATVYGIVKQSGGYIWVYSEPEKGTCFKIYLPRTGASEERAAADTEIAASGANGRTILIAEDEDAVRLLMIKACTKAGYRLLAATNGEEAVSLAANHKGVIDLLLTDVIMPGMNGRILADQVTALRPETRVLYCSGYAENAIVHHGVLNHQAVFIAKPFTSAALLQAVREILA